MKVMMSLGTIRPELGVEQSRYLLEGEMAVYPIPEVLNRWWDRKQKSQIKQASSEQYTDHNRSGKKFGAQKEEATGQEFFP